MAECRGIFTWIAGINSASENEKAEKQETFMAIVFIFYKSFHRFFQVFQQT